MNMNDFAEMNSAKTKDRDYIQLMPILKAVLRKLWIVILITGIFGCGTFGLAKICITPSYRVNFSAYVNNMNDSNVTTLLSSSDVTAARSLTSTYAAIVVSRPNVETAIKNSGYDVAYEDFMDNVTVSEIDDTALIRVSVTTNDPQMSYAISAALAECSLDYVAGIVQGSSMSIVTPPVYTDDIYSPNYMKLALVGAAVGFLLAVLAIGIRVIRDDSVKSVTEIYEKYGLTQLGQVHDLASSVNTEYAYRKK